MDFVRYVDNRFQELAVEATKLPYSSFRDGESNAIQFVLSVYRVLFAAIFIPKIFVCFLLVNLRILKQPYPAVDILKAQKASFDAAAAERKTKLGRKIGHNASPRTLPEDF